MPGRAGRGIRHADGVSRLCRPLWILRPHWDAAILFLRSAHSLFPAPLLRHSATPGAPRPTGPPANTSRGRPHFLTSRTAQRDGARRDGTCQSKRAPPKGTREGPLAEAAQAATWSAQGAASVLKGSGGAPSRRFESWVFFRHAGAHFGDPCTAPRASPYISVMQTVSPSVMAFRLLASNVLCAVTDSQPSPPPQSCRVVSPGSRRCLTAPHHVHRAPRLLPPRPPRSPGWQLSAFIPQAERPDSASAAPFVGTPVPQAFQQILSLHL